MPDRDPALYLRDMAEVCDRVLAYTAGIDLPALLSDRMRYDAASRNLEMVGEAATRVPDDVLRLAPQIPWRQIVGARNRLIHAYLGIEPETIWLLISRSVPALRVELDSLLARLP